MKELTDEAKDKIIKKLEKMQKSLDIYDKLEADLKDNPDMSDEAKEVLYDIPFLRAHKANEVFSFVKVYGWLRKDVIGDTAYNTMFNSMLCSNYEMFIQFEPYIKVAYKLGKLTDDEYKAFLIGEHNAYETMNNSKNKDLKALK